MKKKSKIILLSVLALVLILISLIAILANNSHTVVGVKNYYKISSENSDYIHFSLDDFGNYKNLYFQSNRIHSLMSDSYGSMFIAEYDKKALMINFYDSNLSSIKLMLFLILMNILYRKQVLALVIGILKC